MCIRDRLTTYTLRQSSAVKHNTLYVALTFGLPIESDDFIMNKTCTLKDSGFVKHYFRNLKTITKTSIEDTLNDLLVEKKRSELNLTRDEQMEQHIMLHEVIKNAQTIAA